MKKSFEFIPIPEPKRVMVSEESSKENIESKQESRSVETIRMFVDLDLILADKIKDYSYWEGLTQSEIICKALQSFMQDKVVKSRPEAVKKRPKSGRKSKSFHQAIQNALKS